MNDKLFSLKDFINYSKFCFKCETTKPVRLIVVEEQGKRISYRTPIINSSDIMEIDLKISYEYTLKFLINCKTNLYHSNNLSDLKDFLSRYTLYFARQCDTCHYKIFSFTLEYNQNLQFVRPIKIKKECLEFSFKNKRFVLESFFEDNLSTLSNVWALPNTQKIQLPLIPKYSIKDKKLFIEKMKMYLTFS